MGVVSQQRCHLIVRTQRLSYGKEREQLRKGGREEKSQGESMTFSKQWKREIEACEQEKKLTESARETREEVREDRKRSELHSQP